MSFATPSATWTSTSPAGVVSFSSPSPLRAPQATPVAIVACPQNGTSASGEKYRTTRSSPSAEVTNAVSE